MDRGSARVLRVGAVRYLNAKPLYHRLREFAPGVRLEMEVPSRLAERLAGGDLDVALIPSVEYLRGAAAHGYRILAGFAIAARGEVRSVRLFCRVAPERIRRVALDEGSRTSQALALIWLDQAHGLRPEHIEQLPLGTPLVESAADAVLLIGDRAMRRAEGAFHSIVDLGAAWNGVTGLPFVFALWVARAGLDLGDLPAALDQSRCRGLAEARMIAEEHAPRLGLDADDCEDYLRHVIHYDLGPDELAGLRRFAVLAAQRGLAPGGVDLVFHDHDHDRRLDPAGRR